MQNRLLFTALLLSIAALAGAQKPIANSVYFDTDQSELKPEARQTLERLFVQIDRMPDFDISIEAYTDDRGTADYNKALAERRAGAVQTFLATRGYQPRRVVITPVGISSQQRGKSTTENRRLNRRVDVTVSPNLIDDFRELGEKTASARRDEFTLEAGQKAVFTSSSGVKLNIPAGAFVLPNGKAPDGPITVRLQEAARPTDWILQGLSTHTTDGEILQTGGMYHIEALAGTRKLQLREGATLGITLPPAENADPEMEIFYGSRDASRNAIAWEQAERNEEPAADPLVFDARAVQRFRFFDSIRIKFNDVKLENQKKPRVPFFSKELLRRSARRAPRSPRMREPLEPVQPVAQAPLAPDAESAKRLREKDNEAMNAYRKKMVRYREKKVEFEQRWAKFRKDSADYNKSLFYREECLAKLRQYENDLHTYCLKNRFNERISFFREYYWANYLNNGLSDLVNDAHQRMLSYSNLRERNKLRRQLRQPLVSNYCRYKNESDSLYCGDPDVRAWQQRGRDMLKDLCASSGYNEVLAGINAAYDSMLEAMRETATKDVSSLIAYTFEVNRLDWINIDKFYKYPEGERAPMVIAEADKDTRVFLVFREFSGALALPYLNGRFVSPPLPKGIPVTVVGLKLRSGSPQLMMLDAKAGDTDILSKGQYETLTLKQLQEKMAALSS